MNEDFHISGTAADECELFERIRGGDEQAFTLVYERYHGMLYSLALRMIKQTGAAEDAVQYVFVRLWEPARRIVRDGQPAQLPLYDDQKLPPELYPPQRPGAGAELRHRSGSASSRTTRWPSISKAAISTGVWARPSTVCPASSGL